MKDTGIHTTTDAAPTFLKGRPWLPALVCTALIICAAALLCLADEPDGPAEERAAEQPAPAEAAPAAAEPADASEPDLPRHEDGTINYYQVLVDRYSARVTPENNGAVPLVRALGPKVFDEKIREEALALLGLSDLPEDGPYLERLDNYYERTASLDQPEDYDDIAVLEEITSRPWSAAEYPIAAGWLEDSEGPLVLIVEATQRSHFYMPKISLDDPPTFATALLPELSSVRQVVWALSARAMLKLDSGDVEGAWQDLLVMHGLGTRTGRSSTLIELLVGMGMDGSATRAGEAIITSSLATNDQLRSMLADMHTLSPTPGMATVLEAERLMALDCVMMLKRAALSTDPPEVLGIKLEGAAMAFVDWDTVEESVDKWYGWLAAATLHENYAEHRRLTRDLQSEFHTWREKVQRAVSLGRADRKIRTEAVELALLTTIWPEVQRIRALHEEFAAKRELNELAAAALLHAMEHNGEFPAELADLAPDYLSEIPVDGFTGEAMRYVRTDDGCKIYSVGPNMIDDGGFNYDDVRTMGGDSEKDEDPDAAMPEGMTEDADDIVIELGRAEE